MSGHALHQQFFAMQQAVAAKDEQIKKLQEELETLRAHPPAKSKAEEKQKENLARLHGA
jgi:hypothetical protein